MTNLSAHRSSLLTPDAPATASAVPAPRATGAERRSANAPASDGHALLAGSLLDAMDLEKTMQFLQTVGRDQIDAQKNAQTVLAPAKAPYAPTVPTLLSGLPRPARSAAAGALRPVGLPLNQRLGHVFVLKAFQQGLRQPPKRNDPNAMIRWRLGPMIDQMACFYLDEDAYASPAPDAGPTHKKASSAACDDQCDAHRRR